MVVFKKINFKVFFQYLTTIEPTHQCSPIVSYQSTDIQISALKYFIPLQRLTVYQYMQNLYTMMYIFESYER